MCYNDIKIFIEFVMYGRIDNFICLFILLCDLFIDLSGKVILICQGKSFCDINGFYDGLEKLCNISYFNIFYICKKSEFGKMIQFSKLFVFIFLLMLDSLVRRGVRL